jgi:type 1 glutamine amidotransferase
VKPILLSLVCAVALSAAPIRVQITTGGHPYAISFYSAFEGHDDLSITVNPHPSSYTRPLRRFVDVLVLYDLNEVATEKEQQNLRAFLENGGGLVVLHHALADNWQWKWWYDDVVGGRFLMAEEGDTPRSKAKAPVVLEARPVVKHPVLDGVGPLKLDDEGYKGMYLSPKSKPLLEVQNPDNDNVVAWIGPWEKSRVVAIQLGHGPGAHLDPGYRKLVYNAILWAAGKK